MKKISGPKIASTKLSTPKAAEKAAAVAKPSATKAATQASGFPRSAWADPAKLAKSIATAHSTESHPRLKHAKPPHKDPIGGEPARPPIAMRYGLRPPNPGQPPAPPHPAPPIAMRYGLRPPNPRHPTDPPVRPPPIAMRYGLRPPENRPGIPTTPRPGHSVD